MKNKTKIILSIVIFCFTIQGQAQDKQAIMEEKGISISNFIAEHISDTEIKVTVNYSYVGRTNPKEFFIYAFPQDGGGKSMAENVNTEWIPLKTGNNHVSFTITKRLHGKNFTSQNINICMLAIKRKIYCQDFLFTKSWKTPVSSVDIITFETNKTQVNEGEPVVLTWQTENATRVHILEKNSTNIYKVEASGTMTVTPEKTTTYVLLIEESSKSGAEKQENKSITITINSAPEIIDFRIDPQSIYKGDPIRFYWEVKNAQNVRLYDSYGEIKSIIQLPNGELGWPHIINGTYRENLDKTETYILKATNNYGTEEMWIKVTVMGKKID
ncbi:MAG: hypothetical protein IIC76_12090 [Bacteroidetes bacterium]|nr:hypothetical protein [Bacteroidota bacterium]